MGLAQLGVIDIDEIDSSLSFASDRAERSARGNPADSVIWENVEARIDNEGPISGGMVALFAFAGGIAAVAILIDSAPIVVGAMALCPDFGPIAAFAVGSVRNDRRRLNAVGFKHRLIAGRGDVDARLSAAPLRSPRQPPTTEWLALPELQPSCSGLR